MKASKGQGRRRRDQIGIADLRRKRVLSFGTTSVAQREARGRELSALQQGHSEQAEPHRGCGKWLRLVEALQADQSRRERQEWRRAADASNQGLLRIQSQNPEVGEGSEEVDVDYAGEELRIGFNARYLARCFGTR